VKRKADSKHRKSGKREAGSEHRKAESGQREADNNISPRGKSEGFCEAERGLKGVLTRL